jgi:hypothetical protein
MLEKGIQGVLTLAAPIPHGFQMPPALSFYWDLSGTQTLAERVLGGTSMTNKGRS